MDDSSSVGQRIGEADNEGADSLPCTSSISSAPAVAQVVAVAPASSELTAANLVPEGDQTSTLSFDSVLALQLQHARKPEASSSTQAPLSLLPQVTSPSSLQPAATSKSFGKQKVLGDYSISLPVPKRTIESTASRSAAKSMVQDSLLAAINSAAPSGLSSSFAQAAARPREASPRSTRLSIEAAAGKGAAKTMVQASVMAAVTAAMDTNVASSDQQKAGPAKPLSLIEPALRTEFSHGYSVWGHTHRAAPWTVVSDLFSGMVRFNRAPQEALADEEALLEAEEELLELELEDLETPLQPVQASVTALAMYDLELPGPDSSLALDQDDIAFLLYRPQSGGRVLFASFRLDGVVEEGPNGASAMVDDVKEVVVEEIIERVLRVDLGAPVEEEANLVVKTRQPDYISAPQVRARCEQIAPSTEQRVVLRTTCFMDLRVDIVVDAARCDLIRSAWFLFHSMHPCLSHCSALH